MSKKSTANALAQQVPTKYLRYIIEALEVEIERIRTSRTIRPKAQAKALEELINIWQIYKNALEFEATILVLCSIR